MFYGTNQARHHTGGMRCPGSGKFAALNELRWELSFPIMKIVQLLMMLSIAIWMSVPLAQGQKPLPPESGMKSKGMHEDMQAEMKAMDEKLDKLVVDMNAAATPEKRLEAVMAVINEMVAQHKKMHERMEQRWMKHHESGAEEKKSE